MEDVAAEAAQVYVEAILVYQMTTKILRAMIKRLGQILRKKTIKVRRYRTIPPLATSVTVRSTRRPSVHIIGKNAGLTLTNRRAKGVALGARVETLC